MACATRTVMLNLSGFCGRRLEVGTLRRAQTPGRPARPAGSTTFGTRCRPPDDGTIRAVKSHRRASSPRDRAARRVESFPRSQHQMVDWLGLMHRQHTVHALLEVDVSDAAGDPRAPRAYRRRPVVHGVHRGQPRARGRRRPPHARLPPWAGRVVLFDDVDVTVLVETDVEGTRIPFPHIVRAANRKAAAQIHDEIRAAQAAALRTRRVAGGCPLAAGAGLPSRAVWARSWPTRAAGSGSRGPWR